MIRRRLGEPLTEFMDRFQRRSRFQAYAVTVPVGAAGIVAWYFGQPVAGAVLIAAAMGYDVVAGLVRVQVAAVVWRRAEAARTERLQPER